MRRTLTDPKYNLREIAKQLVLLEDHLVQTTKRCPDCIKKHLLTVEALAEEATQLGPGTDAGAQGEQIAEAARTWMERFADGQTVQIAPEVRQIRKSLASSVADPRLNGLGGLGRLWEF